MIFLIVIAITFIITRNVALSMGVGIFFLSLIVWLIKQSALATALAIVPGILIGIKFLPTARAAWAKSESSRDFIFDDSRQHRRANERR